MPIYVGLCACVCGVLGLDGQFLLAVVGLAVIIVVIQWLQLARSAVTSIRVILLVYVDQVCFCCSFQRSLLLVPSRPSLSSIVL